MMLSDREIIRDLAIEHIEGEGDFLLCTDSHVGDDDE